MATQSKEIKKALKKAFPSIKFSVTYEYNYGYSIKWSDGIVEGATNENVRAITSDWDTRQQTELAGGDSYYSGDCVRLEHKIEDDEWKQFVIARVLENSPSDIYFDETWNSFRNKTKNHDHNANKTYNNYLCNGIKTDLDDYFAICDRDYFYKEQDQQKIEKLLTEEKEYLADFSIDFKFSKYLGQETNTIKVTNVKVVLDRPEYRIYNREVFCSAYGDKREKPKAFDQLKTKIEFTILNKESNQESKIDFDTILNIFHPITPEAIASVQIRFINNQDWERKLNDFKYYKSISSSQDCLITEVIKLSKAHYDRFTAELSYSFDWLKEKGGTDSDIYFEDRPFCELSQIEQQLFEDNSFSLCVLVFAENKEPILIDTQGYSYARYVAKIDSKIAKKAILEFKTNLTF